MHSVLPLLLMALAEGAVLQPVVSAIRPGELLLWESYPYRTVQETEATVAAYRIARLGYSGIRAFQRAAHLRADGVIGPATCAAVAAASSEHSEAHVEKAAELKLTVEKVGEYEYVVRLSNSGSEPVTLLGRFGYRDDGTFLLSAPTAFVGGQCAVHSADGISDSVWSREVALGEAPVVLQPGGSAVSHLSARELRRCNGGYLIGASVGVLGADLRATTVSSR